ncbi:MAG: glycosyltransferase [Anaerolineae bacterium]|nr:glycosyltransferase [Anaerolineae bacterium]
MRLIYLLLSPTFGMHQYTADLANRMAAAPEVEEVHVVTTSALPRDRYSPAVCIHTPVAARTTGFSAEGPDLAALRRALRTVEQVAEAGGREAEGRGQKAKGRSQRAEDRGQRTEAGGQRPEVGGQRLPVTAQCETDGEPLAPSPSLWRVLAAPPLPPALVHLTGVHLWNVLLVPALHRRGLPVVHTLHDLDPHVGVRFGALIRLWNRLILRSADRVVVHGQVYRRRLVAAGLPPERVVYLPLLHLFLDHARSAAVEAGETGEVCYEPWALFFGRLEPYKGVDTLLAAVAQRPGLQAVVAGAGKLDGIWPSPLPAGVALHSRRVGDAEALDLFRRCGLLVLPYRDATQSALIAAAYAFSKPVVATRVGALPEYVVEGETGWVVPPNDPVALAEALAAALADPGRLARMGAAGRRWYEAQRAAERHAWLQLYRV